MKKATVHAAVRATIEVPVRASESGESLQQLHDVALREAEGILRNQLPPGIRVSGLEFSHAVVRADK